MPQVHFPVSQRFVALDLLSTLTVVVNPEGTIIFANAALESAMGMSRRMLEGVEFAQFLSEPSVLRTGLKSTDGQSYAALSFDSGLQRAVQEPLFVHVTVTPIEHSALKLVELWVLEQQARQDREERLVEQAQANKELVRNLAHEIKNPLGGIRGAAQLLEMDLESK